MLLLQAGGVRVRQHVNPLKKVGMTAAWQAPPGLHCLPPGILCTLAIHRRPAALPKPKSRLAAAGTT